MGSSGSRSASRSAQANRVGVATGGAYLNFTPEADRIRDAYGAKTVDRLVPLKDEYDPDNMFRMNQNIKPSERAGELLPA